MLSRQYRFAPITATVAQISAIDASSARLVLKETESQEFLPEDQGVTIRLKARRGIEDLQPGDRIALKVTVFPPSRPSYPGAFDFGLYFSQRNIGGVGYATGDIAILEPVESSDILAFAALRQQLQQVLLRDLLQPEAGIAVALTTGEKTAIAPAVREAMTASGLAHMLAISGMHMAIVCGLVFFGVRFVLAAIPALALRYPIKQYAALFGLVSGALYLALAGFPISATRAYTMVALMFTAILLYRDADALRSLVLAALLLLLINPASVMDIGFQLSFSATLALILAYRRLRGWHGWLRERIHSHLLRAAIYILEAGLSSLIATFATAPLIIYHFNQLPAYSLLANMLALPLLSLLVAPMLVLALLLSLLGLYHWPLEAAGYGLFVITSVAEWVAALPYATFQVPAPHGLAIILMLAGVFGMLIARRFLWGLACMVMVLGTAATGYWHTSPHVLIAEDGSAIAVREEADRWVLLKGTPRNFHVEQWQQRTGGEFVSHKLRKGDMQWICDKAGCDGTLHGKQIRLRFDYKSEGALCREDTDILISTFYSNRWSCASASVTRIDRDALEKHGAHALWIEEDQIRLWHACQKRMHYPWSRCSP